MTHSKRFEVFMVVKIQIDVFWVVTLCSVVVGNQGFRRYAASIFRSKMVL
jgi:hypothetical protein